MPRGAFAIFEQLHARTIGEFDRIGDNPAVVVTPGGDVHAAGRAGFAFMSTAAEAQAPWARSLANQQIIPLIIGAI